MMRSVLNCASVQPLTVTASPSANAFPMFSDAILTYVAGTAIHASYVSLYCLSTAVSPDVSSHKLPAAGVSGAVMPVSYWS